MQEISHLLTESGLVIFLEDITKVSTKPFKSEEGLVLELSSEDVVDKASSMYVQTKEDGIQVVNVEGYNNTTIMNGEYCSSTLALRVFIETWVRQTRSIKNG